MNHNSASTTPRNAGVPSNESSSTSSPYPDYMNATSTSRPPTSSTNTASTSTTALRTSSSESTPNLSLLGVADPNDHLQQLKQMTQGVGLMKVDADANVSSSNPMVASNFSPELYTTYGTWQYYQQFAPMGQAGFSAWPPHAYTGTPWQNYAQSKKGRQTYQRYQTTILEGKFQQNSYVSKKQREELRNQTGLSDRQIKIWFQNRRMKAKKEKHRCDEQTVDHQSIALPSSTSKPLNSALQRVGNGLHNGMGDQDDKKSLSNSMSPVGAPMWPMSTMGMHAAMTGMQPLHGDNMAWTQNNLMLPQGNFIAPHQPGGLTPINTYNCQGFNPYSETT
uniref:EGL-5 n=1 Tax=Bursaphelenchus xylophilus TaxID=6326 RepID=A0A1I7SUE7_BURXY|nr:EGL-5 [Bursaphelenchus xylophilus]